MNSLLSLSVLAECFGVIITFIFIYHTRTEPVAQPGFRGGGTGGLVGARGVWGTEVPSGVQGQSGSGGIASRKLIAVIKYSWLPNHAQFCVFSSTAQPGIFL